MTRKAWDKLREGSIIKSARSGVRRKVLRASNGCIVLQILVSCQPRSWWGGYHTPRTAGVDTTTYCAGDKKAFEVVRY